MPAREGPAAYGRVVEGPGTAEEEVFGVGGTRCFREKAAREDSAAEGELRGREEDSILVDEGGV